MALSTLADGHTLAQEQACQVTTLQLMETDKTSISSNSYVYYTLTSLEMVIWHTPNLLALPEHITIKLHITQAHVVISASIAACKQ